MKKLRRNLVQNLSIICLKISKSTTMNQLLEGRKKKEGLLFGQIDST